jgi:protein gp37
MTAIEWTDATWNPVAGCTRVSSGCDQCYAVRQSHRLEAMGQEKYAGLTVLNRKGDRHFNGVVRCVEEALPIPLKWRKPRRVFVNSMSDLFHEGVPFEFIARVWGVMRSTPKHTYQILTKRPERAAEFLNRCADAESMGWITHNGTAVTSYGGTGIIVGDDDKWPLPNVWLGTSCEDQAAADERIPHLLRCPAAVRFLSCEPLLGGIDLTPQLLMQMAGGIRRVGRGQMPHEAPLVRHPSIDWVIAGGESGPGARPCNVDWIRDTVAQCAASGVPCFVKQLGANIANFDGACPTCGHNDWGAFDHVPGELLVANCNVCGRDARRLRDAKGNDPSEWPEDLRVRQWPDGSTAGAAVSERTT